MKRRDFLKLVPVAAELRRYRCARRGLTSSGRCRRSGCCAIATAGGCGEG